MISLIHIAHAASDSRAQIAAKEMVEKINNAILFPLIALLMAVAFVIFLWGAFEYVKNANNETARETGRNHLLYGVIGMLIMLSAYTILGLAAGTFGLERNLRDASDPLSSLAPGTSFRTPSRPAPRAVAPELTTAPSTPLEVIADLPSEGFGSFDGGPEAPVVVPGTETFTPNTSPPQLLTPADNELYAEHVTPYEVKTDQDVQNILAAYEQFGVTKVLFMIDAPHMYNQGEAGSFSQQEYLCEKQGGSITLEYGANRVTSRNVYACLR